MIQDFEGRSSDCGFDVAMMNVFQKFWLTRWIDS